MTYVISDIHGEYERYMRMLETIGFCDEDTLYVAGDVVDRGERPVDILLDMMSRPNVLPILGNHELMALDVYRGTFPRGGDNEYVKKLMDSKMRWSYNGGDVTSEQINGLGSFEKIRVWDYIRSFPLYRQVEIKNKKFLIVHAGLGNYSPERSLDSYTPHELVWKRPDPSERYVTDDSSYIISGHTPTRYINGTDKIYLCNNNICIDCGAVFGGSLACLCLDYMTEYYT